MSNTFDSALNKNIGNAFEVVRQTYESMKKLFSALDVKADEKGYISLVNSAPNFLRWRSDQESSGWLVGSAIKLYQKKIDPKLEGGWRNGPVFLIEVQLLYEEKEKLFGPEVVTAQFTYENMEEAFPRPPGMGDHGRFYHPLRKVVNLPQEHFIDTRQIPFEDVDKKYGGLLEIKYKRRPLAYIDQANFEDLIKDFEEF